MNWPGRLALLLVLVMLAAAWVLAWRRPTTLAPPVGDRPAVATEQRVDLNQASAADLVKAQALLAEIEASAKAFLP